MRFGIVSLFPDMFQILQLGITGKAIKQGLLAIELFNPRDFAKDKHKSVDDKPYGGGPGMLMMPEPLQGAIHAAKKTMDDKDHPATVIYLSPQGRRFDQEAAHELIAKKSIILIAGRYEGIDQRIIDDEVDQEWSIGDYILTGGELAAMVMIDAMTRLIPGAIHDQQSVTEDSLSTGLLKYPQYTKPDNFLGKHTPTVLLSGHHQEISLWRLKASLGKTWLRRPDLLEKKQLNEQEIQLLSEFIAEFMHGND